MATTQTAGDDAGGEGDEGAESPLVSKPPASATKAEIAQAATDAGFFDDLDAAMTWTKAELLALWDTGA